jgi:hypothetical protein
MLKSHVAHPFSGQQCPAARTSARNAERPALLAIVESFYAHGRLADRSFVVGPVAIQYHSVEEIFTLAEATPEPMPFIRLQSGSN